MAPRHRVLVVGATGQILPITLALIADGHQVFALTRASSRQKNTKILSTLESAGVQLVEGDIASLDSLRSAFQRLAPVEVVVSAVAGPQVLEQAKLIQAIKEAGSVTRFLPSEFSVDIPRARAKLPFLTEPRLKIMKLIQTAGLPYTVITSNGFLEDWFAGVQVLLAHAAQRHACTSALHSMQDSPLNVELSEFGATLRVKRETIFILDDVWFQGLNQAASLHLDIRT